MLDAAKRTAELGRYLAGRPVETIQTGRSPHAIIFRQNKSCVRYFAPAPGVAVRPPVFISMPLINTWTIFDLLPGRSVVEALCKAGVPVYVLDWGRPGPEDAEVTVSDLIDGLLHRSMDRARRHASAHHGAEALDAIGYCVGGTFLAIYLARHPGAVRRVAFVATPIDFHKAGKLGEWVRPEAFPVDELVSNLGNYPGRLIKGGFVSMKPTGEASKYVSLWERVHDEGFRELWAAMEQWNEDTVDFPGEAYREYIRACYFDNRLLKGGWMLAGQEVSLKRAAMPATAIAATKDHIVPPASAFALDGAWGGPVKTVLVDGGHVGMCVGRSLPNALLDWVKG